MPERIVIGIAITLPRRRSPEMQAAFERVQRAGAYFQQNPGGVDADKCHLVDLADAVELLANISRRARATSQGGR